MPPDSPFDPAVFESTILSVVRGVTDEDAEVHRGNLDTISRLYAFPLFDYLTVRLRMDRVAAEDLVQEFLLQKLLVPQRDRNLAARYLRKRRAMPTLRFRDYLRTAIKNFAVDRYRRGGLAKISIDQAPDAAARDDVDRSVQIRFDRQWATSLLRQVIEEVRRECEERDQADAWAVFERRLLEPARGGGEPPTYDELARRLNLPDAKTAANLLQTTIRKFNRRLRSLVAECLSPGAAVGPAEIDEELRELRRVLADAQAFAEDWLYEPDLFTLSDDPARLWGEADLRPVWARLTGLPWSELAAELWAGEGDPLDGANRDPIDAGDATCRTLAEMIASPRPPLDQLRMVKGHAKRAGYRQSASPRPDGPPRLCAVVYTLAIAAAAVRHGERITRAGDEACRRRVASLLRLGWLDPSSRELLRAWEAHLRPHDRQAP